jgi:hypothetical protein
MRQNPGNFNSSVICQQEEMRLYFKRILMASEGGTMDGGKK